ncbi:MAG: hypothetical protein IJL88_02585 [Clostridia bacterium]|nr:hypothetical protein [Clostridia bacterium]
MRKLIAFLVAMMMLLNISFALAADTFEENVAALMNSMDPENGDLLLTVDAAGQNIAVQLGKDDLGVHAAAKMAGMTMGEMLIAQDAAYVKAMGMGYKVKYQTVVEFAQKMISNLFGELKLSKEQVLADVQMLAGKLTMQIMPLMQTLTTEEVENGIKYVVKSEEFAEALTAGIDSFVEDADIAACIDRYAPVLSAMKINLSADALKNAWAAKKDQVKDVLAQTNIALTMYQDGTYAFEMLVPNGERKIAVLSNGSIGQEIEMLTTAGYEGEEPEMTVAFSVKNDEVIYDVKSKEMTIYEKITMGENEIKTFDYVVTTNGETMMEAHYAEDKFTLTAADFAMTYEVVSKEARKMEAVATIKQNGEEQVVNMTVEVLDDSLACTMNAAGQEINMNLGMTEKGTWTDLTQDETLTELTEETIMQLMGSMM